MSSLTNRAADAKISPDTTATGTNPSPLACRQYEAEPPLGPIDWDPAIIEAFRPIWRPPLEEILTKHPHLARPA
jgi:hypothetical protein